MGVLEMVMPEPRERIWPEMMQCEDLLAEALHHL